MAMTGAITMDEAREELANGRWHLYFHMVADALSHYTSPGLAVRGFDDTSLTMVHGGHGHSYMLPTFGVKAFGTGKSEEP